MELLSRRSMEKKGLIDRSQPRAEQDPGWIRASAVTQIKALAEKLQSDVEEPVAAANQLQELLEEGGSN